MKHRGLRLESHGSIFMAGGVLEVRSLSPSFGVWEYNVSLISDRLI